MNREIKFRAWDRREKQMKHLGTLEELALWFKIYPESYKDFDFMQFTGLKDKNGKEIYESDVVEVLLPEREPIEIQRMAIEWEDTGFIIANNAYAISLHDIDEYKAINVVGNIYENPSLHYSDKYENKELLK